jgi:hypothetical protein
MAFETPPGFSPGYPLTRPISREQIARWFKLPQTVIAWESAQKDILELFKRVQQPGGSGIEEAPNDGNTYGRRNEAWTIINNATGLRFTFASNAPTDGKDQPGDEWLDADSGILYTFVRTSGTGQWVELGPGGMGTGGAVGSVQVDVQVFAAPGSHTWTKPTGAVYCWGYVAGGGGGGAAGGALVAYRGIGSQGGSGGALVPFGAPASAFGATEGVTVGAGGAGGVGYTGAFPLYKGNDGGNGATSSFADIVAYGGTGGVGGSNAVLPPMGGAGAAGPGSASTGGAFGGSTGDNTSFIGGAGAPHNVGNGAAGPNGARAFGGGQSGAAGGGGVEFSTVFKGGDAYEYGKWAAPTVLGGTSLVSPHGASLSGTIAPSLRGAGGGGGAGVYTGACGNGGDGQQPGGGGGGAGSGGGTSGPGALGGKGGDGLVIVVSYLAAAP